MTFLQEELQDALQTRRSSLDLLDPAFASSLILSHNHPSGNLRPSQADISLTKKVKAGGELLDMAVLDHIIMTSEGYYSFADEGLMWFILKDIQKAPYPALSQQMRGRCLIWDVFLCNLYFPI